MRLFDLKVEVLETLLIAEAAKIHNAYFNTLDLELDLILGLFGFLNDPEDFSTPVKPDLKTWEVIII